MPGVWTTKIIKDGASGNLTMRVWDESGAGTGPFSFGQTLSNGDGVTAPPGFGAALTTAQPMASIFQLVDLPTDGTYATRTGALTETAPASDTASSGLNGRLQRIAQRITSLIGSTLIMGGDIAHASADTGLPVKGGHKSTTSLSALTLVTNAQRTDSFAGVDGVQIIRPHCNLEDIVSGRATDTAGTSTACIAAQAAGIKTYLTSVALANSSATAVTVNILDGASIKYTLSVPAGSGNNKEFTVPIPGTAATAWNFQSSAAATTVTCSMVGFKSKV